MQAILLNVAPPSLSPLLAYYIFDTGGDLATVLKTAGIMDLNQAQKQSLDADEQVRPKSLRTVAALTRGFSVDLTRGFSVDLTRGFCKSSAVDVVGHSISLRWSDASRHFFVCFALGDAEKCSLPSERAAWLGRPSNSLSHAAIAPHLQTNSITNQPTNPPIHQPTNHQD